MSIIYDNIEKKFEQGLHDILTGAGATRADFCIGYFNLRGWKLVADEVDRLPGETVWEQDGTVEVFRICRLLVGMQRPALDLVREMYAVFPERNKADSQAVRRWKREVARDFRKQLTIGAPTDEDERGLRLLLQELLAGKVAVKLHCREPLHAKLYLVHRPQDHSNPVQSIMGSSNLTYAGLTKNGELNANFGDPDDGKKFKDWFDARWDDRFSIDITQELIETLQESWASPEGFSPYEVYLKIIYHLSREAREGVAEYSMPPPFNEELFDFQKTAVQIAIRHLEKRRGAMIGDVVGLGKTITACAVAKYYEHSFGASTLVICPANLVPMWKSYAETYDLKMVVRSVAKDIQPEEMRFFRLVIVDESHNLRNRGQRYAQIKDFLDYQGSKVLLLTATPYNKDFTDLANQLKLFLPGDQDLGIAPERAIAAAGGPQEFARRYPDIPQRSLLAFEKSSNSDDWRDLMKLFLVRRTRSFVKEHYAATDPSNKRKYLEFPDGSRSWFPERIPKALTFPTRPGDMFERLYSDTMADLLAQLALPRYGLTQYVDEKAKREASAGDKDILDKLSTAGTRLIGLTLSGLYKRMDSSGVVFLTSLYRHAVRNAMFLHAQENGLDLPLGENAELGSGCDEDAGEDGDALMRFSSDPKTYAAAGRSLYESARGNASANTVWLPSRYFVPALAKDIRKDNELILRMLEFCGEWRPAEDEKLNLLLELVQKRHPKDKLLIFSEYADTARYLHHQFVQRGVAALDVVDGKTPDVLAAVQRFSPVSNKAKPLPAPAEQTRVLIATDTLSEGQNLQDAHIVVNYDLPWAIIRLVQRAGRVDRIGQEAGQVLCYSFFPQEGLENILRLRARLKERIRANAKTVGSDEVFFEGNERNLTDIFTEKSGILDERDAADVDLASQAFLVWDAAVKADPELAKRIPALADVVFSTKQAPGKTADGVITYARTRSDADALVWLNADGSIASQSPVAILEALACAPNTPALPRLARHHDIVRMALQSLRDEKAAMGILGARFGMKYRLYTLLSDFQKENAGSLFDSPELRAAIDAVFNRPLREGSANALRRMLRDRPAPKVVEYALELFRQDNLVVREDDGGASLEPRIVCSLGLSTGT